MKAFADIFRAKKEKELKSLQGVANIVGKDKPEVWDEFAKDQVVKMIAEDDDLMEKFIDAAVVDLTRELAIKPDSNHELTEREKALKGLADALDMIFN